MIGLYAYDMIDYVIIYPTSITLLD